MNVSDAAHVVICDAGPLIHLDELRCLDLLNGFGEILVPAVVWDEVQHHRPSVFRRRAVSLKRVDSVPEGTQAFQALLQRFPLDPGEEQALRLMQRIVGAILLTDDAAARGVAESLGYRVHGSIAVLLHGLKTERRTKRQIINLIRAIPKRSSLHIKPALLDSILSNIGSSQS